MAKETLWEAICRLSGEDGAQAVSIAQAVEGSAVTEGIAQVEIRRFIEEKLVVREGESVRLTDVGRLSCSEVHRTGLMNRPVQG